jgi:hypothetical protein
MVKPSFRQEEQGFAVLHTCFATGFRWSEGRSVFIHDSLRVFDVRDFVTAVRASTLSGRMDMAAFSTSSAPRPSTTGVVPRFLSARADS